MKVKEKLNKKEMLMKLYWEEGSTQSEIGKKIDISEGTVSRLMKKYEIPTRRDFIRNFCKYSSKKECDYYLRFYLLRKKYSVHKFSPQITIESKEETPLKCLKNYLNKKDITSSFFYSSYHRRWRLVIIGYRNIQILSQQFNLPYWEELKDRRKHAIHFRRGELKEKVVSCLKEEWLSIDELLNTLKYPQSFVISRLLYKLVEEEKAEMKVENGKMYFRLAKKA